MSKSVAIVVAVVGWVAVAIALNFHKIVPHASEAEIRPFLIPIGIFAVVATLVAFKKAKGHDAKLASGCA